MSLISANLQFSLCIDNDCLAYLLHKPISDYFRWVIR